MIKNKFGSLKKLNQKSFIPYVVANYPDEETFSNTLDLLNELGADLIEVGLPFSDPIAEGKIIESAHHDVLSKRFNLSKALEIISQFRKNNDTPIILMGYTNSFISPDLDLFIARAREANVDGFLIVDLPYVETDIYKKFRDSNLEFIQLIAPTTPEDQIELCLCNDPSFVYFISQRGVTGSSNINSREALQKITQLRAKTELPVVIGFGLNSSEQINEFKEHADGFVIGSAIVKLLGEPNSETKIKDFLNPILKAIKNG